MDHNRCCSLEKNESGLYDLQIHDNSGALIVDVKSIPFLRAVCLIENYMDGERPEGSA
jgi:hypothetical protein